MLFASSPKYIVGTSQKGEDICLLILCALLKSIQNALAEEKFIMPSAITAFKGIDFLGPFCGHMNTLSANAEVESHAHFQMYVIGF